MTQVIQQVNLNLIPQVFGANSVLVPCSQYDKSYRVIQFNVYNGRELYSIPSTCTVIIRGTKKDLTGFEYNCEFSGSQVIFPLEPQITVLSGKVPAELRIVNGEELIGSANFLFMVEPSPLTDDTIISETDLPLLESALEASAQAESFKNLAEQSATDASTSATEASESASTATTKAEESAESALKSEGYAVGEQNGEPVDETSIYYHNNAKWYSQSGGGTHNYEALANKPSINNVTLVGDKSLSDLGVPTKTSDLQNDSGFLTSAVTTFNGQSGAVTYSAPVSSVNGQTGAVTGLQTTNNLVTSVSSASTDSQYPSAKCLYDMVGDIETLLASI